MSLRRAGLLSVTYVSAKPPSAWRGTPAEDVLDLENLARRTIFFSGSSEVAALNYPKNANLAATIAMAGIGFERTQVQLVADPGLTKNVGTILAVSEASVLELSLTSEASPSNPKTSVITAMSVLALLDNRAQTTSLAV